MPWLEISLACARGESEGPRFEYAVLPRVRCTRLLQKPGISWELLGHNVVQALPHWPAHPCLWLKAEGRKQTASYPMPGDGRPKTAPAFSIATKRRSGRKVLG